MPVATESAADSKETLLALAVDEQMTQMKESVLPENNNMEVDKPSPFDSSFATPSVEIPILGKTEDKPLDSSAMLTPNHDQHTVIIFDWDDTLLASSFLHSKGYRLDTNMPPCDEVDNGLKQLEQTVISVLNLALQFGDVNIVTNAETGWVQLSAAKFMPGVVPLLSKCTVISARSTWESEFPDAPLKWKYQAMHERLNHHYSSSSQLVDKSRHVISFGDSHVEREAVRQVTKVFDGVRCKSVKFAERPSMEQLRRQIELVVSCFQYIYTHDGDLDLMLTISLVY
jgi:hypothetical protein